MPTITVAPKQKQSFIQKWW